MTLYFYKSHTLALVVYKKKRIVFCYFLNLIPKLREKKSKSLKTSALFSEQKFLSGALTF